MAGAACCGAAARRSVAVPLLALLCLAGLCCVAGAAGASQRDHYEVLGISSDASAAEVKRAYKQLALRYHPDKNKAEDAEKVFIELQKAYEVLGDPERRRRYDARSRFFISEENHEERDGPEGSPGAPDFGRGSVLDTGEAVQEAINSGDLWLFHIYVDRQTLFGQWMAELPDDFGLGHLNVERTEEFMGMLRDMHNGRMSSLPFLMVCQSGRCRSFVPNTGGFFFMFRSVTQDVLEEAMQLVDYWRNLAHPESDEELREFAEFRPGGSARLRVMVFVEEEGERHFGMYSAANSLKGVAHVAQFCYFRAADGHGRPQQFLSKFRINRLPATVFFDPISGAHFAGGGQLGNVPEIAERILRGDASSRLNPVLEFDANTYEWRCGGRCGSVALLATPPALEADGKALAAALGSFSKACESLKALQHLLPEPVACFWLRLGRAPSWDALFKPHRRKAEAPFAALLLHGSAAVAPDGLEANSRSLFRWLRDGLGRGGPREGAAFALGEWPALPQALGLNEEADYGFSFDRAWRQVCIALARVKTAAWQQLAAWLHPSEQDMSFYGIVLLVLAAALLLWYWLGEDEPPAEPSLEEALQGLEFQLTVGLPRKDDEKLGFGIAGHKQGGLEIKCINQGGLLEAWNERAARAEHRVHAGDRIVWVSWMDQGNSHSCSASRGVELMAKALKEVPHSTEVVLTVLPGTSAASRFQRFDGTVTLEGLMLKDCARFAYGVAEDGSQQADLEVVAIKRPLAEWNRERLREGACSSQRLEPGDRIVAVAVGGHTHVAQHLSDVSPTVYVAKWRAEGSLVSQRVEAAVERANAEEPWGLFLAKRGRGEEQRLSVKRLAEDGVVGRWNAASSSPVLRGDRLISVNGCTSPQEIAKELQELRVVLQFERWLEPSATVDAQPSPTPPPPCAAGEEELPSEQPPCGRPLCNGLPNDRQPADGPLAEVPCDGGPPDDEPPGDGWDLELDDALASTADHAAPAPAAARREAAGEGPPVAAAAPRASTAPEPVPAEESPRLPAGSTAAEAVEPPEEVADRPTPTGGGWDLDFGGLDDIIEPSKPSKEPQAAATASTDSGATSLGGCQPDWTLDELDFEELAKPSKSEPVRATTPSSAAAEAQAEVGLPDFALVDEGGAWLQTEGPCVLAARGSAAYLRAVAGLASALGPADMAVAFFREPRLPPDSLLVVLPRESRCRWLQWRGLDGLSGDCQNARVAEARQLLERLCASSPADAPPPRPLLPLRFEPSDFARRAFGACLARPCN